MQTDGTPPIAIVGAGIAGLSAALRLRDAGRSVVVFEAADHVGGAIRSEYEEGYRYERGPNTVLESTPLIGRTIERLGLSEERLSPTAAAKKRFVVRDGKPVALPSSLRTLIGSPLLGIGAKLRLLREPFVAKRPDDGNEESVAALVERRLGPEVLRYFVDPFVAGVFAGTPDTLSARHAFAKMHALEQKHGSFIRGAIRTAKARRREREAAGPDAPPPPSRKMFSFREGLDRLPTAIAALDGIDVRLRTRVTSLDRVGDGWRIGTEGEDDAVFDRVLLALPAHALGALAIDGAPNDDLATVAAIEHPPITVLQLGFRREDVAHPLDGFGVLVPSIESRFRILGALFPSSIFEGRAPEGHVLLSVFLGGTRRPDDARLPEEERLRIALADLRSLLGVSADPRFVRQIAWERSIPQYRLDHGERLAAIESFEASHPGLALGGNYRTGISVPDTLQNGHDLAGRWLESESRPAALKGG